MFVCCNLGYEFVVTAAPPLLIGVYSTFYELSCTISVFVVVVVRNVSEGAVSSKGKAFNTGGFSRSLDR